jgi:diketogulonate reductase-like aldo/keto reductase
MLAVSTLADADEMFGDENVMALTDTVLLSSNVYLPLVTVGLANVAPEELPRMVNMALASGVQMVDTSQASGNEELLGATLAAHEKGKDVKIMTKVWYTHLGYARTKLSVERSLKALRRDQLDVALLHYPRCDPATADWMACDEEEAQLDAETKAAGPQPGKDDFKGSWKALQELFMEGKVANIGVSNFELEDLKEIVVDGEIPPQLIQSPIWKTIFDPDVTAFCRAKGIHFQAHSPLSTVLPALQPPYDSDEQKERSRVAWGKMEEIAEQVSTDAQPVTPAMLIMSWLHAQQYGVVSRTSQEVHMKETIAAGSAVSFSVEQLRAVSGSVESLLRASSNLGPSDGSYHPTGADAPPPDRPHWADEL